MIFILNYIDLHTHTKFSDGSYSPEKLIRAASDIGLRALSITDHDTLEGYLNVKDIVNDDIELIPGVEISVKYGPKEIHVLGYYMSDCVGLQKNLYEIRERKHNRNHEIIYKLQKHGINITIQEVEKISGKKYFMRPDIAKVLVDKGIVENEIVENGIYRPGVSIAFNKYLKPGKPGYVECERLDFKEGIQMILGAGGIPIMAHPGPDTVEMNYNETIDFLSYLKTCGMKGIELYHTDHSDKDVEKFSEIAKKLGLLTTGGSDFHGIYKHGYELGAQKVPYSIVEDLKKYKKNSLD